MDFKKWLLLVEAKVGKIVYKYPKWPQTPEQLVASNDRQKDFFQKQIAKYMRKNNYEFYDPKQFVHTIRHAFTTYDQMMNIIFDWPLGYGNQQAINKCNKLRARIKISKDTFALVQAVIDLLAPPELRSQAHRANSAWLSQDKWVKYRAEERKFRANCAQLFKQPDFWAMPYGHAV